MTSQETQQFDRSAWRSRTLVIGGAAGLLVGLLSALLYLRAADEHVRKQGVPPPAGNGELIGLALAVLAVVRQISELGRPDLKRK
ncbi:MAG: hypothetical protein NZM00_04305 [Anaerolinea sp.]|nr:hypothetical protein [Anaerolinea sp.]